MFSLFQLLLGWLPEPLYTIACGVIVIFAIVCLLRFVAMILDIIPFL